MHDNTRTHEVMKRSIWVRDLVQRGVSGRSRLTDILALGAANDPFNLTDSRLILAVWFGDLWSRFGRRGMHLRSFHYVLVGQRPLMPDPTALDDDERKARKARKEDLPPQYENDQACWKVLGTAFTYARYLFYVDPTAFVERRSDEAQIYALSRLTPEPTIEIPEFRYALPSLDPITLDPPGIEVYGYDYDDADQPVQLEVWIEKSTQNDVLVPLCRDLGLNLVVGHGFSSITRAIELLQRVRKPTRIFYCSDFDPGGWHMPFALSRQLEFWHPYLAPDVDVKLTPLVLTADQVRTHHLPRNIIDAGDKRRKKFEQAHGAGCTELDALEALVPGELERIIRQAVAPYRDPALQRALAEVEDEAFAHVDDAWATATAGQRERLAEITEAVEGIRLRYADQLRSDLEPFAEELRAMHDALFEAGEAFDPSLPDRPTSDLVLPDESDFLFDSHRDYEAQLEHYHRYKRGEDGEPDEEGGE